MSFERPITILEVIENINKRKYLLPAIQREFVWDTEQIELLFDSLMRGYPIGSFLFWSVEKVNQKKYQFYEFMRNYHERDNTHNTKANIKGDKDLTAILDGQQRFTALYISLKGSYAYKLPRKRWGNDDAFPTRKLYINLLSASDSIEKKYDFCFLTDKESKRKDDNKFWFKVEDVLELAKPHEVNNYLIKTGLAAVDQEKAIFANETLFRLQEVIHKDKIINYFFEKDESLNKVLNIFVRANSGGTELSHSDLLLSIASAQWKKRDAREEITTFVDEINNIGDGFNCNKDFVLKSCLVLSDFKDIAFKVDNFKAENMLKIENNWDEISQAIRQAVNLVSSFGYNRYTLTSNNALIPIAYYLYKKGLPNNYHILAKYKSDRKKIFKWLIISLLKRTFSGQPDNVLRPVRLVLKKNSEQFPLEKVAKKLKGRTKSITFNEEEIENIFDCKYGQSYTFSTLALLYPSLDFRNKFHQDHIFPKRFFTPKRLRINKISDDEIQDYLDNYNYIANLQLLEGIPNQEKGGKDFKKWLIKAYPNKSKRKDYMRKNYIPEDIDLSLTNFPEFIKKREELLFDKFKELLDIK